jgi:hypothetical protein
VSTGHHDPIATYIAHPPEVPGEAIPLPAEHHGPPVQRTALTAATEKGLAHLWDYVKEHRTACVARSYTTPNGYRLGEWVNRRRKYRGENPWLDRLLESLPGWAWVPYDQEFAEKLDLLKTAVTTGRPIRNQQLRTWIHTQRYAARKGKLSPKRFEQLHEAGLFDLHMYSSRSKMMRKTGD